MTDLKWPSLVRVCCLLPHWCWDPLALTQAIPIRFINPESKLPAILPHPPQSTLITHLTIATKISTFVLCNHSHTIEKG